MPITLRVTFNDLPRLIGELPGRIDHANETTADAIVEDAVPRAPQKSGDLRKSIKKEKAKDGAWLVGVNVPYGARVELGFHGMDARGRNYNQAGRPYLTPAAEAHRAQHEAELGKAINP